MRTVTVFLIVSAMYFTGFFVHALFLKKTVYGDGLFYYTWVRSLVIDRDVNFTNEFKYLGLTVPQTANNLPRNYFSIGPALLWSPAFISMHNLIHGHGYELTYQLAVGASGVLYALTGLVLLFRLLIRNFSKSSSILSILGIAFATNLFFYGSIDTVNSHALTFFAATLFLSFLFANEKKWVFIGASLALSGLIRIQDLVYGLALLPYVTFRRIILLLVGFTLIFLPQGIVWQIFHGRFYESPYLAENVMPFANFLPHIPPVLFSPINGLFLWTPIILVSTIGLFRLKLNRFAPHAKVLLLVVITELIVISSRKYWSQQASYSGRMFVSSLPIFALGLAQFFEWFKKYRLLYANLFILLIAPLSIINFILIIYYLFTKG